ncbi:MAG: hypothetical protein KDC76_10575 [Bacteroidetes bacterium]|nr:hypothetical protein [Bacteroidota bacterium]
MRGRYISVVLGLMLFLGGCMEDGVNQARKNFQPTGEFLIRNIQIRENGDIACVGSNRAGDTTKVYLYDQNLNLKNILIPSANRDLKGYLHIQSLKNNDWLVVGSDARAEDQVVAYRTNPDFNILHRQALTGKNFDTSWYAMFVYEVQELDNGDLMVVHDDFRVRSGFKVSRLGPDLSVRYQANPWFQYEKSNTASLFISSPKVMELSDGRFAGCFMREEIVWVQPNVSYEEAYTIQFGIMDAQGEPLLETQWLYKASHAQIVSISETENSFVIGTIYNDEHLLHYHEVDKVTGKLMQTVQLDNHFRNNRWVFPRYLNHFGYGEANRLPQKLSAHGGHFLYTPDAERVQYVQVQQGLKLTPTFTLFLPPVEEVGTMRQVFTNRETMLVGVSYQYNGLWYFNLQEVDFNGEIVP